MRLAIMDFMESIMRDISPPEAAPPTGMGSWFLLKANRNSTESIPVGPSSEGSTAMFT